MARTTRPKAYSRIADCFYGYVYLDFTGNLGHYIDKVEECGGDVVYAGKYFDHMEIKYKNKDYQTYIQTRLKIKKLFQNED